MLVSRRGRSYHQVFLQQANLTLYMLHILYDIDDMPTPDAARSLIELILS